MYQTGTFFSIYLDLPPKIFCSSWPGWPLLINYYWYTQDALLIGSSGVVAVLLCMKRGRIHLVGK